MLGKNPVCLSTKSRSGNKIYFPPVSAQCPDCRIPPEGKNHSGTVRRRFEKITLFGNGRCRAQWPNALALAPGLAVMQEPDGISMNLFEPMTAVIPGIGKIEISGNYPFEPEAEIRVEAEKTLDLNIRIPGFTEAVSLNGTPLEFVPGTRLRQSRRGHPPYRSGRTKEKVLTCSALFLHQIFLPGPHPPHSRAFQVLSSPFS